MKTRIVTLASLFLIFIACASFTSEINAEDDIYGYWWTPEKKAKIKIYKAKNGKVYGKVVWLKDANDDNGKPKVDRKNPDLTKRSEPVIGMVFMKGFVYQGDDEWEDGTIYDAESGKLYSCNMELDGKETLEVRGFIGVSLIGRTEYFTKAEE